MQKLVLLSTVLLVTPFTMNMSYGQCVNTLDCQALGYTKTSCTNGGVKCPTGNYWYCPKDETGPQGIKTKSLYVTSYCQIVPNSSYPPEQGCGKGYQERYWCSLCPGVLIQWTEVPYARYDCSTTGCKKLIKELTNIANSYGTQEVGTCTEQDCDGGTTRY